MNIRFGKLKVTTPKVEKVEVERFDYPVLIMHPAPTEPKGKYRFELNKAALAMLNLQENDAVEFGFTDEAGNLLEAPVMGVFRVTEDGNKVNTLGNFFNKQLHADLCTFFNINNDAEVVFTFNEVGEDIYSLERFMTTTNVVAEEVLNNFAGDTVDTLMAVGIPMGLPDFEYPTMPSRPSDGMEPNTEFGVNRF